MFILTTIAKGEVSHVDDPSQTGAVAEILVEEFMEPLGLTQTALILARVFGNSPEFWLNTQRRTDLWLAQNDPVECERVARATPLSTPA